MSVRDKTSNYEVVKEMLRGRWGSVIGELYPEFIPAMKQPGKTRIPCPKYGTNKGAKGDGFRFFKDFEDTGGGVFNKGAAVRTGIDLIAEIEGCAPHEALAILENYLGLKNDGNGGNSNRKLRKLPPPAPPVVSDDDDPEKIAYRNTVLSKIWESSTPLAELDPGHDAIRYFTETRGIADGKLMQLQDHMRFCEKLYYTSVDGKKKLMLRGVVSMYHNAEKRSVGLHRTYLDPNKPVKAKVDDAKKAIRRLGAPLNGGVYLRGRAPSTHHINLCEGIETGLSIAYAIGRPVIAATTAQLLESWQPSNEVKAVTVWADRDPVSQHTGHAAGLYHSNVLAKRLYSLGIKCRILLPSPIEGQKSVDWNDVLHLKSPTALVRAYSGQDDVVEVLKM